jgi:pantothenate kinase
MIESSPKLSHQNDNNLIAIDIGGTLIKICFTCNANETIIPHDKKLTSKYL